MLRSTVKIIFTVLLIFPLFSKGQVTAGFTASDTAGCAPLVVHFTNTSTGATSYSWNLGNGTLSSLADVSGAYLTAGTYTISLVASNGGTSSTKTMTIRVYAPPTVNFTANDTTICPGGNVIYSSAGTTSGAWGPITYNWNFGDGLTSTLASPSHTYVSPGNYNVTLFATSAKGCINSRSRMAYVEAYTPPVVGFTVSNTLFCHPVASAVFSNTSVGTGPLTSAWRFGDGGSSALLNPTRNYTTPGTFDVTLKMTDGNGCVDSATYPAFITVGSLVSDFTAPVYACPYNPVVFTNASSTHLTCQWDFGDSTTSPDENPEHIYTVARTYTVTLVVYDGSCFDTVRKPINIVRPSGSFTISPTTPCPPPVVLTFNASVPSGSTVQWKSLYRGGGILGTGTTFSYNFPPYIVVSPGGHTDTSGFIDSVTMIVTDSHGCKDTVGRRDTVNYPKVYVGGGPHLGCTPLIDTLRPIIVSSVYNPFCLAPWYYCGYPPPEVPVTAFPYPYGVTSYTWSFGDGSPTSSMPSPSHVYTLVGGEFWPKLRITTSNGCIASSLNDQNVIVGDVPPTPTYTITPTRACAGRPISFKATGTGVFISYAWDYGDGNADSLASPTHTYTVPGIYTVDVKTVFNGCMSLATTKKDTIDSANAIIHLNFDCLPRTKISFVDWSSGDDSRLWQFGDGATSTTFNPVHTYSAIGTYPVTLTTYNIATGCRDTMVRLVSLEKVKKTFYVADSTICKGFKNTFAIDEISEPGTDSSWIVKYKWFVDGVFTDSLLSSYQHDTFLYTFNIPGPHTVMAVLEDNRGCFDTVRNGILVANPTDSFQVAPATGCAPLSVTFTDRSSDVAGVGISSYFWKFGDGYTQTTVTPTVVHVYTANGIYSVKQVITDDFGCKDSLISRTRIMPTKPKAVFSTNTATTCARRSVRFTNTSTGAITCLWLFGDGDTSTTLSPLHSYSVPGVYSVSLVAISAAGCRDTLTKANYITVKSLPTPSFTMDDSFSVCSPFKVNFTNTSTGASSYFWTFGDGTSSVVASPSNVYIRPGYFRVKLLAINSFSCSDTAIKFVNLFGYTGGFTYTPTYGCKPLSAAFSATVSAIASAIWDFSDGVTTTPSLSTTAVHVYSSTGTFVPKLILTDSAGCTSASVGADTIKVDNISADFVTVPNPGCVNTPITFVDTSLHLAPVTRWTWSIAPGYSSTLRAPVYTYTTSGTHPVTLSITDGWGCTATVTKNVTVNTVPAAIGGSPVVCVGTNTTLTNTVIGGTWTSSNTLIATVGSSSGIVNGVAVGTVLITYSLGSGCQITKTITVNPVIAAVAGRSSVCVNDTATLTHPAGGGVWASGNTAVATIGSFTGLVTGVTAGVTTISYSVGGCVATRQFTVNSLPGAIGGNTPVCIGGSFTLTALPSTGTWSSASALVASVGITSGIVSAAGVGTTRITYTLGTGCRASVAVTVNNPPAPITGSSFLCVGGSITLSDVTSGGGWSSANTSVATINSGGVVTGIALGNALISYTAGGCSSIKTVSVVAFPSGIYGDDQVCLGKSIVVYDSSGIGTWSSASASIAAVSGTTGSVTGVSAGATTITYSLGGGCIATYPITVNPLPNAITGSNNVCVGAFTTLSNLTIGGVWSSSSALIAGIDSNTGVVTGVAGGSSVISYTIPSGCARAFTVTVNAVPPLSGVRNMCAWRDTMMISDSDPSGFFSSTGVIVSSLGGGVARVLAGAPGVATIKYTLPVGCILTVPVTVNPVPALISGSLAICEGSTSALSNLVAGGRWSSSSVAVAIIDSIAGVVTGVSGGSSRIQYTLATGCKTDTVLTVIPVPYTGTILGPSSLCVGRTVTLVDSFPGGIWSVANGHVAVSGGNVTGISAGVDTVKYEIVNTCGSSSATRTVTVIALPYAGNISGPVVLCEGDSIILSSTAAGGAWSSQNTKAVVSVNGIVKGMDAGTDTIFYTFTNTCGVDRASHGILINPLPDAGVLSGPAEVCIGDTIAISGTVTGGALDILNANAVLDGWTVRGVYKGLDTLRYSVSNTCGSAVTFKQIAVDSLPYPGNISGANEMCVGDSTILTASVRGGLWAEYGDILSLKDSVVVHGLSAGIGTVSYTVTNNCGTSAIAAMVTVNPLPDGLQITRNEYLLYVSAGYKGYQWTINGKPIPGATSNTYRFSAIGNYGVTVVNEYGCTFTYDPYAITDCSVEDIQIFPNPATSIVTIQWCKKVSVKVSGTDGKQIMEVKDTNEIDIGDLPNGIYSITLYDSGNNRIITRRVTKIR